MGSMPSMMLARAMCACAELPEVAGSWTRGGPTFREVGCPAPPPLSASLEGAMEDAEAKPLKRGPFSWMLDSVKGACSPMLPSLPSSGIAEPKADACAIEQFMVQVWVETLAGNTRKVSCNGLMKLTFDNSIRSACRTLLSPLLPGTAIQEEQYAQRRASWP